MSPKFGVTVRIIQSQAFVRGGGRDRGVLVPVVEGVVMVAAQSRPDEPSNIPSFFAVEVDHAPQSVCVKDDAPENISFMLITLDTSHLEMSPLNDDAEANMPNMLVTLDTSHLEMSPLNDDAK